MHFGEANRSFDRTWRIGVSPILDRNRPKFSTTVERSTSMSDNPVTPPIEAHHTPPFFPMLWAYWS